MTWLTAALLGIVQGLTEFLPVSSSAHLILVRAVMGWNPDAPIWMAFDVACHVGTLLAVVAAFYRDLLRMLFALPQVVSGTDPDARRLRLIVIGTVPVVIAGLLGGARIEDLVRTPAIVAVMLVIGAVWMLLAERLGSQARRETELNMSDAFLVGVAQVTALVPGISRSGVTIGAGMLLGFERADIAKFTFLLSVPAILAAAAKSALELRHTGLSSADAQVFFIGMITSAIVGYAVVKYLLRFLTTHRLDVFVWYRLALAAAIGVWLYAR
jgi:undecaprenyl-diphosphatase